MAFLAPQTWTASQLVDADDMNRDVRDNMLAIDAIHGIATAPATGRVAVGDATDFKTHAHLFVTSGSLLVRHEVGGLETDISLITTGTMIQGASSGVAELLTIGSTNEVLAVAGGKAAWTALGTLNQADQTALEAETNEDTYAPPDLIRHSPGVAKGYCTVAADGTLQSNSYNVDSVTDSGTGDKAIVWDADFGNANYSNATSLEGSGGDHRAIQLGGPAVGSSQIITVNDAGSVTDIAVHTTAHGDQV